MGDWSFLYRPIWNSSRPTCPTTGIRVNLTHCPFIYQCRKRKTFVWFSGRSLTRATIFPCSSPLFHCKGQLERPHRWLDMAVQSILQWFPTSIECGRCTSISVTHKVQHKTQYLLPLRIIPLHWSLSYNSHQRRHSSSLVKFLPFCSSTSQLQRLAVLGWDSRVILDDGVRICDWLLGRGSVAVCCTCPWSSSREISVFLHSMVSWSTSNEDFVLMVLEHDLSSLSSDFNQFFFVFGEQQVLSLRPWLRHFGAWSRWHITNRALSTYERFWRCCKWNLIYISETCSYSFLTKLRLTLLTWTSALSRNYKQVYIHGYRMSLIRRPLVDLYYCLNYMYKSFWIIDEWPFILDNQTGTLLPICLGQLLREWTKHNVSDFSRFLTLS